MSDGIEKRADTASQPVTFRTEDGVLTEKDVCAVI